MDITVTGGAGYVGSTLVPALIDRGHRVSVLDALLHDQQEVADALATAGARLVIGDVSDRDAVVEAVDGADAVVHLAAIVGDPACARNPGEARRVNLDGSAVVLEAAVRSGVERFVFASTCSNYGRMDDPTVPIDESGDLAPVSLYAEQKVEIERRLLGRDSADLPAVTCLRFATVYGVAPRMRFDLTVNEFTRDRGPGGRWRCSVSSSGARTCTSATPPRRCAWCWRRRRLTSPAACSTSVPPRRTAASRTWSR